MGYLGPNGPRVTKRLDSTGTMFFFSGRSRMSGPLEQVLPVKVANQPPIRDRGERQLSHYSVNLQIEMKKLL